VRETSKRTPEHPMAKLPNSSDRASYDVPRSQTARGSRVRRPRVINRDWGRGVFSEIVANCCHFLPRPENVGKVRKPEWPLYLRSAQPPANGRGTRRLQNVANSVGEKRRGVRTNWTTERREIEPLLDVEAKATRACTAAAWQRTQLDRCNKSQIRGGAEPVFSRISKKSRSEGHGGKTLKADHGLSFIITAGAHRNRTKTQVGFAFANGLSEAERAWTTNSLK
jgi:hypothetical protein